MYFSFEYLLLNFMSILVQFRGKLGESVSTCAFDHEFSLHWKPVPCQTCVTLQVLKSGEHLHNIPAGSSLLLTSLVFQCERWASCETCCFHLCCFSHQFLVLCLLLPSCQHWEWKSFPCARARVCLHAWAGLLSKHLFPGISPLRVFCADLGEHENVEQLGTAVITFSSFWIRLFLPYFSVFTPYCQDGIRDKSHCISSLECGNFWEAV